MDSVLTTVFELWKFEQRDTTSSTVWFVVADERAVLFHSEADIPLHIALVYKGIVTERIVRNTTVPRGRPGLIYSHVSSQRLCEINGDLRGSGPGRASISLRVYRSSSAFATDAAVAAAKSCHFLFL